MAFVRFPAGRVGWFEAAALFARSNAVERGFYRYCGTPLSYRHVGGPNVSLTLLISHDPASVRPEPSFSAAARPAWCAALAELPDRDLGLTDTLELVNHQR